MCLEHISGLSMSPRTWFGSAGVFFCRPCFELVAAETWSLFRELDNAYAFSSSATLAKPPPEPRP
jgi:hypothetical protein